MAIFSKLRPSDTSIAQFASIYAVHRPLIQRFLTTGFVLYVLSTTYRGLAARPRKPSSEDRNGKERKRDGTKAPRVAVSNVNLNPSCVSLWYRRGCRWTMYSTSVFQQSFGSSYLACGPRKRSSWSCTQVSSYSELQSLSMLQPSTESK